MITNPRIPTVPMLVAAVLLLAACAARPGGDNGAGPEAATPVAEIVGDLEARTGADPSAVEVLRAEAVTWRDSSLGCPEPGMMYMQALVEGYWVILRYAGESHDYRATRGGRFVLCTQSDRQKPI